MRMKTRSIPRQFILGSVDNYEVIEEYPEDKYFPSYLVYTKHRDTVLHIQFATVYWREKRSDHHGILPQF